MSTNDKDSRVFSLLKPVRPLLFALLLPLALVDAAAADTWTLGFGLGTSDLDGGAAGLDFRAEVRAGYHFSPRFALEGQLSRAAGLFNTTLETLMVNGIFELRPGKAFAPYLLAGVGVARFNDSHFLSNEPSITRDGDAWQVGFGTRSYYGAAQRIGLQIELSRLEEQTSSFASQSYTSLTAGMTWKLGR